jgi:hypothetical protein
MDDVVWGKLPILPPERSLAILPLEPSSSKPGGFGRRKLLFFSTKYFFHTRRIILRAVKSYDMGCSDLFPVRGSCAANFYLPSKSIALGESEPTNLGSSGKHTNHYTTETRT